MTWPVGQGKSFGGIVNLRTRGMTVFESGSERLPQDFETVPLSDRQNLIERFGHEFETAEQSMELATGASPTWDHAAFLAGRQTPVFFGSGVNNFGVQMLLDFTVEIEQGKALVVNTMGKEPGDGKKSMSTFLVDLPHAAERAEAA